MALRGRDIVLVAGQYGYDRFAEIRMRNAYHGAFNDARRFIEYQFDLFGVNVVSSGDDQVFVSTYNADIAIAVCLCKITSDKKTIFA